MLIKLLINGKLWINKYPSTNYLSTSYIILKNIAIVARENVMRWKFNVIKCKKLIFREFIWSLDREFLYGERVFENPIHSGDELWIEFSLFIG
ncbi:hypothetical protein [Sphingobacterium mizutaii]|uniref:hypothetical protein n=1 Tax=Sphingobacterium mizutaii TaxID=1010 RepID=UPI003D959D39